jgi:hypothetical protein
LKCSANKPRLFEATKVGVDFSFENMALFLANQIFQVMNLGMAKKVTLNNFLFTKETLYDAFQLLKILLGVFGHCILVYKICKEFSQTFLEKEHSKNK